jgi:MOSC domain-containing protein YiiM
MQAAPIPERTLGTARGCIGRVASVFLAYRRESTAREVREVNLTWVGVRGDRHASAQRAADARTPWHPKGCQIANTRHVSIVSLEECAELAALLGLPNITPDLLSANIACTAVAGLSSLPPSSRLQFPSGATIYVTDPNEPCRKAGRALAKAYNRSDLELAFPRIACGRRGVVGIVERQGLVHAGDEFRVIRPRSRSRPVQPVSGTDGRRVHSYYRSCESGSESPESADVPPSGFLL